MNRTKKEDWTLVEDECPPLNYPVEFMEVKKYLGQISNPPNSAEGQLILSQSFPKEHAELYWRDLITKEGKFYEDK